MIPLAILVINHPVVLEKKLWECKCELKEIFAYGSAPKVGQSTVTPKGTSRGTKDPTCQVWLLTTWEFQRNKFPKTEMWLMPLYQKWAKVQLP